MMKYFIRIIFIISILLCFSFTIDKCYAISSKEEVEEFRKYQEKDIESQLKKDNYKYGRYMISACKLEINSETGEELKIFGVGAKYSDKEFLLDNIVEEVFKKYFDKYLDENLPENERLVDYLIAGLSIYTREENYNDGDDIEAEISAYVFPAIQESNWAENNKLVKLEYYNYLDKNMHMLEGYFSDSYYIRLVKENGEYVIKFMDTLPEGYSEFVEKVKNEVGLDLENINYADFINAKSETEIIAEVAKEAKLEGATIENNEEIIENRISLIVSAICALLIVFIMYSYSNYLRKTY